MDRTASHGVDQLRTFVQPRPEQLVPQVCPSFVKRRDRISGRGRTAAQPGDLREDEPDPVAAFAAGAQLVDDLWVDPRLRINKTLQIERVACRFHMSYGGTVVKRRMPKVRDLAPLIRFRKPRLDRAQRRLDEAQTMHDLRRIARRRTPRAAFDYTDGAAEDEISLDRARQAFRDIEFHPSILRDVSNVRTGWEVLGQPVTWPFAIAPTGFTRLMHTEGEIAGARVAAAAGIPFSLSTLGTASVEEVAAAAPQGRRWFQLYMWRDRERSMDLVRRAADAGFDTLLATVDVPVAGARLRDLRNGMSIPPALTMRTVLNAVPRPRWWFDLLTTEPLAFASLDRWSGTVGQYLDTMFDPSLTFDDWAWIKAQWPGKLVVKGIQTLDDARAAVDRGVDGIVLSNHGGRQLDRAPVPFHLLPSAVRELGKDTEILLDTGIMSGADIVAAVALGARCTLIGRAYLYGLMAGGEAGVRRAIEVLSGQLTRTMRLLGVTCLEELSPKHVTQLRRLVPVEPPGRA
jgi:L-lactate dehydrogenase (cytochrome)